MKLRRRWPLLSWNSKTEKKVKQNKNQTGPRSSLDFSVEWNWLSTHCELSTLPWKSQHHFACHYGSGRRSAILIQMPPYWRKKKPKQDVWLSNTAWLLKHNDKCLPLYASGFWVSETMCGLRIIEVTDPCWPQHLFIALVAQWQHTLPLHH